MSSVGSEAATNDLPIVHDRNVVKRDEPTYEIGQAATVGDLVKQEAHIRSAMKSAMERGIHFGQIPGTPKPTLLKPGAEKLCKLFHLRPHYEELGSVHRDNLIGYRYRCVITHFPTGFEIAEGVGSCNSREKKYRKSDPWDIDNTIVKMACKRALIAAILVGTAASDVFAEDKPAKTKNELHAILNGRCADLDETKPREDGTSWIDHSRMIAHSKWGVESRGALNEGELAELIDLVEEEVIRG